MSDKKDNKEQEKSIKERLKEAAETKEQWDRKSKDR
jgi:hypothetical protein